jgi:4-hydroxy-tetrahydrodipicolinate reductase
VARTRSPARLLIALSVAGVLAIFLLYITIEGDGVPRVETHLEWQMTPHTDPSWEIKGCYVTQIKGDPQVYNKHMIFPKPGVETISSVSITPDSSGSIGSPQVGRLSEVYRSPL